MGKPLQKTGLIKQVNDDVVSNPSDNTAFSQVLDSRLSRRSLLQSSGALGVAAALPAGLSLFADKVQAGVFSRDNIGKARGLGFTPVPMSAADTVVVPEGFDRRLDGAVRRLTVVARRIVSEGTTVLRMLHDEDNELSRVRIFVEAVEGRFTLYGGPTRDTPYALEEAWDTVARPQFSNFLWQDNRAVVKHTPVPPGLLEHGEPMHRVLAALFAVLTVEQWRTRKSSAPLWVTLAVWVCS